MPPVLWDEAEGFLVRDPYGKLLATYAFPATGRSAFLEKLVSLSPIPDSKAILFSAGTEATEVAMFVMRLHGRAREAAEVIRECFQEYTDA